MRSAHRIAWLPFALGLALVSLIHGFAFAEDFRSDWNKTSDRVWIGPDWWANRVEDWRIHDGRLECVQPGMRAAYLATGTLRGGFRLSVRTGMLGKPDRLDRRTFTGFLFSNMGEDDYKTEEPPRIGISRKVLFAGLDGEGGLVVAWVRDASARGGKRFARHENEDIRLELDAVPTGDTYSLKLAAFDHRTGKLLDRMSIDGEFPAEPLNGYVALAAMCPAATDGGEPRTPVRYWYRDFRLSGENVELHDERRRKAVPDVRNSIRPKSRIP